MDTSEPNKFATPFREMADRIERNLPAEFAGAILIVPPEGGKPIEVMIADPTKDPEAFWAMAGAKIQIATEEYRLSKQGGGGFSHMGRR